MIAFPQSIVIENLSPEEIEVNFRNDKDDFFVCIAKSSSKTEGFGDKDSLKGVLYWKYIGTDKIEKFEYNTKILKEDFDEIKFAYLGDKQWIINIYKCKKYRPVTQITIIKEKKILVPLESQYTVLNKTEEVLATIVLVDDFNPLNLGRTDSTCNGNLAYYSRPNKSKKLIYQFAGKEKKYEELEIEFKDIDISKAKCFSVIILNEKQIELKVYNEYPSNSEELLFTKIYDLKIKAPTVKPEEQKK